MPAIIWKFLNLKTQNHPQCFCRCSEVVECYLHFHQQKTTDGSVPSGQHKASETSRCNCLSVLPSPSCFARGVRDLTPPFFFSLAAFPLYVYVWTVLSVSRSPSVQECSLLCGAGLSRAGWTQPCGCWPSAAYCHKYFLKCLLSAALQIRFPWAFFLYYNVNGKQFRSSPGEIGVSGSYTYVFFFRF